MKLLVSTFVFFFLFVSAFADMIRDEAWMKNYFADLKKNYDKRIAPIGENGPGTAVKVNCTMYILDISNIDDSSMDYTAQFYFRQSWNDSRLSYTGRKENILLTDESDIWTPDLFFTQGRESRLEQIVHPNKLLRIRPGGTVLLSIRLTVKFRCGMDLRYFPHDIQKCNMRIESYAHQMKQIDIAWSEVNNPVDASKENNLYNFGLISLDQREIIENLTFGTFKVLEVNFQFERKFGFFAIKLYVPYILLVIVSLMSLWIKAEERSMRFALLVIILYFMSSIASEVSDHVPAAPYIKGSDVWIGSCIALVFAIFLEFIAVALISGRNGNEDLERKGEILMNIESETKEPPMKSDTLKSHLSKLVNMFDARNGVKSRRDAAAYRVDKFFRIVFPLVFIFFNVVYWSVYCCK